jgi:hypothetical protein
VAPPHRMALPIGGTMEVTENLEPFIIFPAMLLSLWLLVIIDRIGTIRTPAEEEEDI